MKTTSKGMILGTAATIVLSILKILNVGFLDRLNWWLVALPFLLVIFGLIAYATAYMAKISYRSRKYQRQQDNTRRK